VSIQSKPTTARLTHRLFGFSFLNAKMLRVGLDNSSFDDFVIGIDRIEKLSASFPNRNLSTHIPLARTACLL
jgi:hypothetical protein